jgi:hypothetical protein
VTTADHPWLGRFQSALERVDLAPATVEGYLKDIRADRNLSRPIILREIRYRTIPHGCSFRPIIGALTQNHRAGRARIDETEAPENRLRKSSQGSVLDISLPGSLHAMLIGTFEAVLTCQLDAARTVRARDTRANFPMPGHALDLYLVVAGRQVKASRASVRRSSQPPQN